MTVYTGALTLIGTTTVYPSSKAFILEGRSVKVEVRKTSAANTGTITAACTYAIR
jgi:hypothetical protein